MKQKPSFIIGLSIVTIAVVMFLFIQKKDAPSPLETRDQTSLTRASQRQDESQTAHSPRERKEREQTAQQESKKLTSFWTQNASAGFALSKKYLVTDLNLSAEESSKLDQIFARRESELADLLNGDAGDDVETMRKVCALLRNKGLREDLAGAISAEKLARFDADEADREHETIEARAYRDMADINAVVLLTDSQKQQALAALMKNAPEKMEHEADARAFMTLNYGQILTDVDSSSIRSLAAMLSAGAGDGMPDADIESSQYQQWVQANKTERIELELSALERILDEKQLTRYRDYLESEPAW
jgi:hypothetical protein